MPLDIVFQEKELENESDHSFSSYWKEYSDYPSPLILGGQLDIAEQELKIPELNK